MTQFGTHPRSSGPLWKKLEARANGVADEPPAPLPTAMQVAAACVLAARQCNEDPVHYIKGRAHSCNGRFTAYWALTDLFPTRPETIARLVGAKRPESYVRKAAAGRGNFYWWDEGQIEEVKVAVLKGAAA